MFRIKTITVPQGGRSQVTIEETNAQSEPIPGREWTEPFDVNKKDWEELKARFAVEIGKDDAKDAEMITLTTEANEAELTDITPAITAIK